MTDIWQLPETVHFGGEEWEVNWEFRDILKILAVLSDETRPVWQRWFSTVDRFYRRRVPSRLLVPAVRAMTEFIQMGQAAVPGPRLFDWQQDAPEIISDINRVAGFEIRKGTVHWWTFLGWFHAIGEGRLQELVSIRSKLARGQKLTEAEQAFYRSSPDKVRLRSAPSPEKQRLEALLK